MVFGEDWGGIYITKMDPSDGGLSPYHSGAWADDRHLYTMVATGAPPEQDRHQTHPDIKEG